MQPEEGPLQVTFDDNKENNVWSYHLPREGHHITGRTKLYKLESVYNTLVFCFFHLTPCRLVLETLSILPICLVCEGVGHAGYENQVENLKVVV